MAGIDSDVGQIAVNLEEKSKKYYLYKINAGFLLLNQGLFHSDTNILGDAYSDKGDFIIGQRSVTSKKSGAELPAFPMCWKNWPWVSASTLRSFGR